MSEPAVKEPTMVQVSESSFAFYYPDDSFAADLVREDGSEAILAASQCDTFSDESFRDVLYSEALTEGALFTCSKVLTPSSRHLAIFPLGMYIEDLGITDCVTENGQAGIRVYLIIEDLRCYAY